MEYSFKKMTTTLLMLTSMITLHGCGGDIEMRMDLDVPELLENQGNVGSDGSQWMYASDMYNLGRGLELNGLPLNDKIYAFQDQVGGGTFARISRPNGEFSPSIVPNLPPALTPYTLGGDARTLCLHAHQTVSQRRTNYWVLEPSPSAGGQQTTTVNMDLGVTEGTRLDLNFHPAIEQLQILGAEPGSTSVLSLQIEEGSIYARLGAGSNLREWLTEFPINESRLQLDSVIRLGITFDFEQNYCEIHLADAEAGGNLAKVRVPFGFCNLSAARRSLVMAAVARRTVELGPGIVTPVACFRSATVFDFVPNES